VASETCLFKKFGEGHKVQNFSHAILSVYSAHNDLVMQALVWLCVSAWSSSEQFSLVWSGSTLTCKYKTSYINLSAPDLREKSQLAFK
jgi:hypothetical protein